MVPEAPLFSGMLMKAEVFSGLPGISTQRPCTRTHFKKACAKLVRLVRRTINTENILSGYFFRATGKYSILLMS